MKPKLIRCLCGNVYELGSQTQCPSCGVPAPSAGAGGSNAAEAGGAPSSQSSGRRWADVAANLAVLVLAVFASVRFIAPEADSPVPSPEPAPAPTPAPEPAPIGIRGTTAGERLLVQIGPGMKMAFRWCPPGSFTMGSPDSEKALLKAAGKNESFYRDEVEHPVTLTKGFWLAETPVTQVQWETVMRGTLSRQAEKAIQDDKLYHLGGKMQTFRDWLGIEKSADPAPWIGEAMDMGPIYYVNWDEANDFCIVAGGVVGRTEPGLSMRLPAEPEWEYACRAGTRTMTYAGDFSILGDKNAPGLDPVAWYGGNSSVGYTGKGWKVRSSPWSDLQYPGGTAGPRRVGEKLPNPWGLADMIGNVWQWCKSYYGDYPPGPLTDPDGPATGDKRVFRGGSWTDDAAFCRAATRNNFDPGYRDRNIGFRPLLAP